MDLILRYLADHLACLWRQGHFQIADSRSDRSNGGDGLLTVESPDLRIRFTCDRRQLMADFQSPQDPKDWYSIDLIRRLWTGEKETSAVLDSSYGDFLRDNLSEIELLFGGDQWPGTKASLKRLKVKRSKELFG
jgi:hypothetical protein